MTVLIISDKYSVHWFGDHSS